MQGYFAQPPYARPIAIKRCEQNLQIGGLLTAFKKQTGQDYNGDEQQTNMLSSLAHQVDLF